MYELRADLLLGCDVLADRRSAEAGASAGSSAGSETRAVSPVSTTITPSGCSIAKACESGSGSRTRSFSLKRPTNLFPGHPHRRPGAVFGDEVGEPILRRSYADVVRRFGPPAAIREHGQRVLLQVHR